MLYSLYATTRVSSNVIEICTMSDLGLINLITDYFNSSENILKFTVISIDEHQNKSLVYEKILEKEKGPSIKLGDNYGKTKSL